MPRISALVKWVPIAVVAAMATAYLLPFPVKAVIPENPTAVKSVSGSALTVHEWGTFTTFAGSNGVQLEFRPLLDSDLPDFVLDRQRQAGALSLFTKGSISAPLRMETPVTYFYTDQPRQVRVRVDFPQGLLTEFYPPVRTMEPAYTAKRPAALGPSSLDWGEITLIPQNSLELPLGNADLSDSLAQRFIMSAPPAASGKQHYAFARETDSALVAVNLPEPTAASPTNVPPPSGLHVEKFLFYRGVGKFDLPVRAELDQDGTVQITNLGAEPIRSLFLVNVTGEFVFRRFAAELPANGRIEMKPPVGIALEQLCEEVQARLVAEGLYPKEAAAMTKTWSDSWFQEQGTRLFYIVPRSLTDEVLPLHVEPSPDETVRVLVGRMELLPPMEEQALLEAVHQNALAVQKRAQQGQKITDLPIPREVAQLGRFAEPALSRVRELIKDSADAAEAQRLLRMLRSNQ